MSAISTGGRRHGAAIGGFAAEWLEPCGRANLRDDGAHDRCFSAAVWGRSARWRHGSLMSGMVPMYFLMGAFHAAPWLRLISARRR